MKFIHAKYLPPRIPLTTLLVGVLCWREFALPAWLGWMLLTVWLLVAAVEVWRMFGQEAGHPVLNATDRAA